MDAGLASYVVADKSKSDIFHDFLPLLNGQLVELLDRKAGIVQERAISQLLALERTVSKQGKDSIGHPRGGVDDVINAIAVACLLARKTPSEAGTVVAMPKRQAVSPRRCEPSRAIPCRAIPCTPVWDGSAHEADSRDHAASSG